MPLNVPCILLLIECALLSCASCNTEINITIECLEALKMTAADAAQLISRAARAGGITSPPLPSTADATPADAAAGT